MYAIGRFIKSTLLAGVLFVVPLVAIALLVREGVHVMAELLNPIAQLIPSKRLPVVFVAELLAIGTLLAICFILGLLVRTGLGHRLRERLEHLVLRKVPGFTLFKSVAYGVAGVESKSGVTAALARIEDAWVPAIVVERHASGLSTVFVPSVPTPAAGTLYFLPDERLKLIDVPIATVMACIMRLGVGSNELLDKANLATPK